MTTWGYAITALAAGAFGFAIWRSIRSRENAQPSLPPLGPVEEPVSAMPLTDKQRAIQAVDGRMDFRLTAPQKLSDLLVAGAVVFQEVAGSVMVRIEIEDGGEFVLYRASPGLGTQAARVDPTPLGELPQVRVDFVWTPTGVNIAIRSAQDPDVFCAGEAFEPSERFVVDRAGGVSRLGSGLHRFEVHIDGVPTLTASAIETWRDVSRGVELLLQAKTEDDGAGFAMLAPNLAISTIVTGWETYAQKRFVELVTEGVVADDTRLEETFFSAKEREAGEPERLRKEAGTPSIALALAESRKLSFQRLRDLKRAYSRGFGIDLATLGIAQADLDRIRQAIAHRHKVVHVTPFLFALDPTQMPPVGINHDFARSTLEAFERAIDALHERTLRIPRGGSAIT